ncbi:MAG: pitrilysin family protein, partial [Ferruginibacter sp.]
MNQFFLVAKNLLAFLLLCIVVPALAQKGDAYEMNVNGVKVIVQPSGNEIVEIQTIIKGGVQNYPAALQGIESISISALTECGTLKDDKNSFKNKLDKVSAQVNGYSGMDYASFSMNCIKGDFNLVWPLYVDALTTPRFDQKEFTRIKQDAINALKAQASDPDNAIAKMARKIAFAGKNYSKSPEGTEVSISKITAAQAKAYYQSILTKSRMLIVVVGEIEKEELISKIKAMLATVPAGKPFVLKKELFTAAKNTFQAEKKDLATNYIQGITGGPAPGTPEFNAFQLAMRIFYDRHFLEIRTKNGLSYAPATWFDGGTTPSANIFVSTTDPDKYIVTAKSLIEKIKKDGFSTEEVKNMKTTYLTSFFYRQETNNAQAGSLVANEVLHNNWRRALTLNEDLKKVSVKDIDNVFNKYISNISWVYQGNPDKVNPSLFIATKSMKQALPKSKISAT